MPAPPLVLQTTYAELLERCAAAAFTASFAEDGAFIPKTIRGRRYWYFQSSSGRGRTQKYVGRETPELSERIAHHKQARDDERERRALVSTLVRSLGLPRPIPEIGNIVAALAKAGVFRLRGVLIGTVAYQTYSVMLGIKLPIQTLQTGDVDIAQFGNVSVAIKEKTPPVIDVLKEADSTFRPVPTIHKGQVTSYIAKNGYRVDFLVPNEGPDTDSPKPLPALQTDALPLRFLDFLIYEPDQAVILHGPGILVLVPSPQRYAVHKLIISRRRKADSLKQDKDIRQAEALLDLLSKKRPFELGETWNEAFERGQRWRQPLTEGMTQIAPSIRDITLKVANKNRSILPGIDLTFDDRPATYDFCRDIITFHGQALGSSVECSISWAALDDYFGTDHLGNEGRLKVFRDKRMVIEDMARTKYLFWPIEEPGTVLIKTTDVPRLLEARQTASP